MRSLCFLSALVNHFPCQVIPVRQGGPGIPQDLLLLQDTPTAVGATCCPVRAGRTSMQRTDVRIGGSWSPACGALPLARFFGTSEWFWINLPGRYMTGSGPGPWRAHLGE
jgi:hypothetical protein